MRICDKCHAFYLPTNGRLSCMAPHISLELRECIIYWRHELHLPISEIVRLSKRGERAIYTILQYHRDHHQPTNPFARPRGRKRVLERDDLEYLDGLLSSQPGLFLDEIQDKLRDMRDVEVSLATLSRTFSRLAITHKVISKQALERNEHLRATWPAVMGQYEPHQLVFIDEAGVDDHTNVRSRGWAPLGMACVRRTSFLRGQKFSILPALSLDGILTLDIFEGSVDRERFLGFLRNYLVCTVLCCVLLFILIYIHQAPHLNPFPMEHSVVVMDNCSTHHNEDIRQIIEDECGTNNLSVFCYQN